MSSLNLSWLRRNRMATLVGGQSVEQIEHLGAAGAKLTVSGLLVPGNVITTDTSAGAVLVGAGSICRIQTSADTYVAFGNPDDTVFGSTAVDSTTSPALKLVGAGVFTVVATNAFIRTSLVLTRLEVVKTTDAGAAV